MTAILEQKYESPCKVEFPEKGRGVKLMNNLNGARKVWTNITKQKFNRVPWPSPRGTAVLGANNKPNICLLTIEKTICTINIIT